MTKGTRAIPKPDRGIRVEAIRGAFEREYPAYQYQFVEFMTEHLADLSRVFRGDLQQMLVLAIIGQVYLKAYRDAMAVAGNAPAGQLDAAISASRLADVTGIPRQTVRRKLDALAARGWIEKMGDSAFRLIVSGDRSPARRDLDAVDLRSIERAARLFHGLEKIVEPPVR